MYIFFINIKLLIFAITKVQQIQAPYKEKRVTQGRHIQNHNTLIINGI